MKALILLADGFEDLQLFYPLYRLREERIRATIAGPATPYATGQHGYRVETAMPIHELNPGEYDLLLIPGGSSPEKLRLREEAVDVARTFMDEGKMVAIMGHGSQLLISAGAMDGRVVACSPGIRDDVRASGATYRDEGVVISGNLISCRGNDDLPAFCARLFASLGARAKTNN